MRNASRICVSSLRYGETNLRVNCCKLFHRARLTDWPRDELFHQVPPLLPSSHWPADELLQRRSFLALAGSPPRAPIGRGHAGRVESAKSDVIRACQNHYSPRINAPLLFYWIYHNLQHKRFFKNDTFLLFFFFLPFC